MNRVKLILRQFAQLHLPLDPVLLAGVVYTVLHVLLALLPPAGIYVQPLADFWHHVIGLHQLRTFVPYVKFREHSLTYSHSCLGSLSQEFDQLHSVLSFMLVFLTNLKHKCLSTKLENLPVAPWQP